MKLMTKLTQTEGMLFYGENQKLGTSNGSAQEGWAIFVLRATERSIKTAYKPIACKAQQEGKPPLGNALESECKR